MWQAAPLRTYEFATYSPSSGNPISRCSQSVKEDRQPTNKDCPDVDEEEQRNIGEFL